MGNLNWFISLLLGLWVDRSGKAHGYIQFFEAGYNYITHVVIFVGRSNQPADSWNLNESASTLSIFQQADTVEVHIILRYFL